MLGSDEDGRNVMLIFSNRAHLHLKMNGQLREAYVGHYFRRLMADRRRMVVRSQCSLSNFIHIIEYRPYDNRN